MLKRNDEPIPGFRLESPLGRGSFGEVWVATSPGGARTALKFILLHGKQGLKEFRAVQVIKNVRHVNLLPITGLWLIDHEGELIVDEDLWNNPQGQKTANPSQLVIGMQLGDKSLHDRLEECAEAGEQGLPIEELLGYMTDAARGLDFLNATRHDVSQGIAAIQHCDVKPHNILIVGTGAAVCDFGLANVLGRDTHTTSVLAGSPAYMAPEVIRSRKPSTTTDQYSLAITYFELRSGKLPFENMTYPGLLYDHLEGRLDFSILPETEAEVLRRATHVDPAERYESCIALVEALREAVATPRKSRRRTEDRQVGRSIVGPLAVAAVLLLTVVGGAIGAWWASTEVDSSDEVALRTESVEEAAASGELRDLVSTPDEPSEIVATSPTDDSTEEVPPQQPETDEAAVPQEASTQRAELPFEEEPNEAPEVTKEASGESQEPPQAIDDEPNRVVVERPVIEKPTKPVTVDLVTQLTQWQALVDRNASSEVYQIAFEPKSRDQLARLGELPSLSSLYLTDAPVADDWLSELAKIKQLAVLDLSGTKVTGRGLSLLAPLSGLEVLNLAGCDLEGNELNALATHAKLRNLDLSGTNVRDSDLAHLAGMTNLRVLRLSGTQVTGATLGQLSGLPIDTLSLSNTTVSDKAIEQLAQFAELVRLELVSTQITASGERRLQQLLPDCEIKY